MTRIVVLRKRGLGVIGIMGFNNDSLTDTRRFTGINSVVHTSRSEGCMMPDTPKGHGSGSAGIASVLCTYCTGTRTNRRFHIPLVGVGRHCSSVVGKLKLGMALSRRFGAVSGGFGRGTNTSCTTSHKRCLGNVLVTSCLKCRFVSSTAMVFFSRRKGLSTSGASGMLSGGLSRYRGTMVPKFCKINASKGIGAFSHNNSSVAKSVITGTYRTDLCRG